MLIDFIGGIFPKANSFNREIFNAGSKNYSVLDIAEKVKKNIGDNIKLTKIKSDDIRSYHISSEKIKNTIGFETKFTIEDAVKDLKHAFDKKILVDTFNNENFFNIKKMQSINLK